MEFKQYPSYKKSGVEWLGDVPEHWQIVRTKDIFNHRKEEALEDDEIVTAFRDGQVTLRKNRRTDGFTNSIKEHGYQHINSGDLVIHEMDAFAGAIGVSDSSGKSTPVYSVCYAKNENINHHFYSHFFRTMAKTGFINSLAKGIRVRSTEFRWNESRNVYLVEPPKSDQQKIVAFLDTETTRIDNLISKQEKLIELLEEQRKSIISHAVTKGLNPNALMKDSGVEWLGRVPCDWQYYSIKRTIKVLTDYTANGSFADLAKNVNYLDYGFSRLVRLTDLREDLNNNGVYITEDAHKYLKKSELFGGELLLANVGAYAGFACLMPYKKIKATLAPNMFLLRFKEQRINNKFMYYLINSKTIQYQFQVSMTSTAQPKLNKDNVKNIVMFLPTLQIQNEIVEYLDSENLILDNLIFKQQALIEKLKEYRASIISHAVTGKIDVREHMA